MKKGRDYQYDYSRNVEEMYVKEMRENKALTMAAVLNDFYQNNLCSLTLLDIGASTGIISNYLSKYLGRVIGIDIDRKAMHHARSKKERSNIEFVIGDGMNLTFADNTFDIVICAQVYEHVPDSKHLLAEIYRALKPGGVCYFAAGNRLNFYEPHYKLPLLSVLPRSLAHLYLRAAGKGKYYYEKHLSFWSLQKLVKKFRVIDYTKKIVLDPGAFNAGYMIPINSFKHRFAKFLVRYVYAIFPGYIWLLQK